ncbi:MAG: redoxin domain-containing protein [Actinomycetota bacterium]
MPVGRLFAIAVLVAGLAAVLVTALGGDDEPESVLATEPADTAGADEVAAEPELLEPLPVLGEVGTLHTLDGWLNTDDTTFEEILAENEVVVVQFWTFACRNCKNTLDAMGELYEEYRDQGVEFIGVHSPEFSFEAEVPNIVEAADELGVVWPIALDTTKRNFHEWQEGRWGYWPRAYLIDSDGQIRQNERGDGLAGYRELGENIQRLLDGEA